jgi:hypothetical protein
LQPARRQQIEIEDAGSPGKAGLLRNIRQGSLRGYLNIMVRDFDSCLDIRSGFSNATHRSF